MTGVEKTDAGSREFALYSADQYAAPTHGNFETVQSVDGTAWYKQYAQDTVEKTPYDAGNGKVAYNESIVQKLPPAPQRKDRDVNGGAKLRPWGSCRCRHSAASHLHAMKTAAHLSKTVAGAAAGPFTAAISAAIANRHTLLKARSRILGFLLLPGLFILMLPGLIFGSLTENTGALNSNALINENIQTPGRRLLKSWKKAMADLLGRDQHCHCRSSGGGHRTDRRSL